MTNTQQQLIDRLNQPDVSGLDDATAATTIAADFRTASPIPLSALRPWANFLGLQSRLARSTSSTAFAAVCKTSNLDPLSTADSVNDALAWIADGNNQTLDTNNPQYAAKTYQLLQLMVGVNGQDQTVGMTADQSHQFLAFGGGVVWGPNSVAAADVTAARAAAAQQQSLRQQGAALFQWFEPLAQKCRATINAGVTANSAMPTQQQLAAIISAGVSS